MQENLVMLIVDDAEVNRASFSAMFMDEYKILTARDGQEAMRLLHQKKVDVVILDVFMPGLGGSQVLEMMRADHALCDIPVIVKTAIDENMELEMLEKGADDFIFSPCEPAIIKNRVRNIVQKYVLRRTILQKQIKEEQHVSRVRERFVMRMARMMKKDITKLQALCGDPCDETRTQEIASCASHLMTMVEEVLEQAQWDQEEQRIHPFFFRLDQIIGELKNKYLELCKEKEIELLVGECEIPYNDLFGDGKRLGQIWCSMVKKVYDHTSVGGCIRTGWHQRKTSKDRVELKLIVEGNMDPEEGYPVAKSLVELLHGSMIIEKKEDCMRCEITLPFRIGHEPWVCGRRLGELRALIVDNNGITRQSNAMIISRLGIACDTAVNGIEAIQRLKAKYMSGEAYDICFINWYMRGAKTTIREIRRLFSKEHMLIICSTAEREKLAKEMKEAGVDYIAKRPVYQEEMYRLLKEICTESGV